MEDTDKYECEVLSTPFQKPGDDQLVGALGALIVPPGTACGVDHGVDCRGYPISLVARRLLV